MSTTRTNLPSTAPRNDLPATSASRPPALRDLAAPDEHRTPTVTMLDPVRTESYKRLRRNMRTGTIAVLLFAGATTGLMANAVIAGAVITTGTMVVETGPKSVQHPVGGVVERILVRDGERVEAGQPMVALRSDAQRAELLAVETTLMHQLARQERLVAERDGLAGMGDVPQLDFDILTDTEQASILLNEAMQLSLRESEREGRRRQLAERIEQSRAQIEAAELQIASGERQIALIEDELKDLRDLYASKLVPRGRILNSERALTDLNAQQGTLRVQIAAERSRIQEYELQIAQVDESLRSGITDQIADTRASVAEMTQRRLVAASALDDRILRAPQAGTVYQLSVNAPGEVAQPGQVVATVVPEDEALVTEVRVRPSDIDQLYPGQHVGIIFSAFDRGTTPQLDGSLQTISPDLVTDSRTGASYYTARVGVSEEELARLGELTLVPGMPVEAFIKTTDRTVLSYLTKPIMDQVRRALR